METRTRPKRESENVINTPPSTHAIKSDRRKSLRNSSPLVGQKTTSHEQPTESQESQSGLGRVSNERTTRQTRKSEGKDQTAVKEKQDLSFTVTNTDTKADHIVQSSTTKKRQTSVQRDISTVSESRDRSPRASSRLAPKQNTDGTSQLEVCLSGSDFSTVFDNGEKKQEQNFSKQDIGLSGDSDNIQRVSTRVHKQKLSSTAKDFEAHALDKAPRELEQAIGNDKANKYDSPKRQMRRLKMLKDLSTEKATIGSKHTQGTEKDDSEKLDTDKSVVNCQTVTSNTNSTNQPNSPIKTARSPVRRIHIDMTGGNQSFSCAPTSKPPKHSPEAVINTIDPKLTMQMSKRTRRSVPGMTSYKSTTDMSINVELNAPTIDSPIVKKQIDAMVTSEKVEEQLSSERCCPVCRVTFSSASHSCDKKVLGNTPGTKCKLCKKATGNSHWECQGCKKCFPDTPSFANHLLKHHCNSNSSQQLNSSSCPICDTAAGKDELAAHLSTHLGPRSHVCSVCLQSLSTLFNLQQHMRNVHPANPPKFACEICTKRFHTEYGLRRHISKVQSSNSSCDICHKVFKCEKSTEAHKKIAHSTKSEPVQILHSQSQTSSTSPLSNRKTSQWSVQSRKTWPFRNRKMDQRSTYAKAEASSHPQLGRQSSLADKKVFQCGQCQKRFRYRHILMLHQSMHTGLKPHSCKVCCMMFGRYSNYKDHLEVHKEGQLIHCNVCHKAFRRKQALKVHSNQHIQKKYKCRMCDKVFLNTTIRSRHYLRHHEYVMMFKCKECKKRYSTIKGLQAHKLIKHTGLKTWKCLNCGLAFPLKSDLKAHMVFMHMKTNWSSAPKPQISSSPNTGLRRALYTQPKDGGSQPQQRSPSQERNIVTSSTGKGLGSLQVQDVLASSPKTVHKCNFCDVQEETDVMLQLHVKSEHGGRMCFVHGCKEQVPGDYESKRQHMLANHKDIVSRRFCCQICLFGFTRNDNFTRHMKIVHGISTEKQDASVDMEHEDKSPKYPKPVKFSVKKSSPRRKSSITVKGRKRSIEGAFSDTESLLHLNSESQSDAHSNIEESDILSTSNKSVLNDSIKSVTSDESHCMFSVKKKTSTKSLFSVKKVNVNKIDVNEIGSMQPRVVIPKMDLGTLLQPGVNSIDPYPVNEQNFTSETERNLHIKQVSNQSPFVPDDNEPSKSANHEHANEFLVAKSTSKTRGLPSVKKRTMVTSVDSKDAEGTSVNSDVTIHRKQKNVEGKVIISETEMKTSGNSICETRGQSKSKIVPSKLTSEDNGRSKKYVENQDERTKTEMNDNDEQGTGQESKKMCELPVAEKHMNDGEEITPRAKRKSKSVRQSDKLATGSDEISLEHIEDVLADQNQITENARETKRKSKTKSEIISIVEAINQTSAYDEELAGEEKVKESEVIHETRRKSKSKRLSSNLGNVVDESTLKAGHEVVTNKEKMKESKVTHNSSRKSKAKSVLASSTDGRTTKCVAVVSVEEKMRESEESTRETRNRTVSNMAVGISTGNIAGRSQTNAKDQVVFGDNDGNDNNSISRETRRQSKTKAELANLAIRNIKSREDVIDGEKTQEGEEVTRQTRRQSKLNTEHDTVPVKQTSDGDKKVQKMLEDEVKSSEKNISEKEKFTRKTRRKSITFVTSEKTSVDVSGEKNMKENKEVSELTIETRRRSQTNLHHTTVEIDGHGAQSTEIDHLGQGNERVLRGNKKDLTIGQRALQDEPKTETVSQSQKKRDFTKKKGLKSTKKDTKITNNDQKIRKEAEPKGTEVDYKLKESHKSNNSEKKSIVRSTQHKDHKAKDDSKPTTDDNSTTEELDSKQGEGNTFMQENDDIGSLSKKQGKRRTALAKGKDNPIVCDDQQYKDKTLGSVGETVKKKQQISEPFSSCLMTVEVDVHCADNSALAMSPLKEKDPNDVTILGKKNIHVGTSSSKDLTDESSAKQNEIGERNSKVGTEICSIGVTEMREILDEIVTDAVNVVSCKLAAKIDVCKDNEIVTEKDFPSNDHTDIEVHVSAQNASSKSRRRSRRLKEKEVTSEEKDDSKSLCLEKTLECSNKIEEDQGKTPLPIACNSDDEKGFEVFNDEKQKPINTPWIANPTDTDDSTCDTIEYYNEKDDLANNMTVSQKLEEVNEDTSDTIVYSIPDSTEHASTVNINLESLSSVDCAGCISDCSNSTQPVNDEKIVPVNLFVNEYVKESNEGNTSEDNILDSNSALKLTEESDGRSNASTFAESASPNYEIVGSQDYHVELNLSEDEIPMSTLPSNNTSTTSNGTTSKLGESEEKGANIVPTIDHVEKPRSSENITLDVSDVKVRSKGKETVDDNIADHINILDKTEKSIPLALQLNVKNLTTLKTAEGAIQPSNIEETGASKLTKLSSQSETKVDALVSNTPLVTTDQEILHEFNLSQDKINDSSANTSIHFEKNGDNLGDEIGDVQMKINVGGKAIPEEHLQCEMEIPTSKQGKSISEKDICNAENPVEETMTSANEENSIYLEEKANEVKDSTQENNTTCLRTESEKVSNIFSGKDNVHPSNETTICQKENGNTEELKSPSDRDNTAVNNKSVCEDKSTVEKDIICDSDSAESTKEKEKKVQKKKKDRNNSKADNATKVDQTQSIDDSFLQKNNDMDSLSIAERKGKRRVAFYQGKNDSKMCEDAKSRDNSKVHVTDTNYSTSSSKYKPVNSTVTANSEVSVPCNETSMDGTLHSEPISTAKNNEEGNLLCLEDEVDSLNNLGSCGLCKVDEDSMTQTKSLETFKSSAEKTLIAEANISLTLPCSKSQSIDPVEVPTFNMSVTGLETDVIPSNVESTSHSKSSQILTYCPATSDCTKAFPQNSFLDTDKTLGSIVEDSGEREMDKYINVTVVPSHANSLCTDSNVEQLHSVEQENVANRAVPPEIELSVGKYKPLETQSLGRPTPCDASFVGITQHCQMDSSDRHSTESTGMVVAEKSSNKVDNLINDTTIAEQQKSVNLFETFNKTEQSLSKDVVTDSNKENIDGPTENSGGTGPETDTELIKLIEQIQESIEQKKPDDIPCSEALEKDGAGIDGEKARMIGSSSISPPLVPPTKAARAERGDNIFELLALMNTVKDTASDDHVPKDIPKNTTDALKKMIPEKSNLASAFAKKIWSLPDKKLLLGQMSKNESRKQSKEDLSKIVNENISNKDTSDLPIENNLNKESLENIMNERELTQNSTGTCRLPDLNTIPLENTQSTNNSVMSKEQLDSNILRKEAVCDNEIVSISKNDKSAYTCIERNISDITSKELEDRSCNTVLPEVNSESDCNGEASISTESFQPNLSEEDNAANTLVIRLPESTSKKPDENVHLDETVGEIEGDLIANNTIGTNIDESSMIGSKTLVDVRSRNEHQDQIDDEGCSLSQSSIGESVKRPVTQGSTNEKPAAEAEHNVISTLADEITEAKDMKKKKNGPIDLQSSEEEDDYNDDNCSDFSFESIASIESQSNIHAASFILQLPIKKEKKEQSDTPASEKSLTSDATAQNVLSPSEPVSTPNVQTAHSQGDEPAFQYQRLNFTEEQLRTLKLLVDRMQSFPKVYISQDDDCSYLLDDAKMSGVMPYIRVNVSALRSKIGKRKTRDDEHLSSDNATKGKSSDKLTSGARRDSIDSFLSSDSMPASTYSENEARKTAAATLASLSSVLHYGQTSDDDMPVITPNLSAKKRRQRMVRKRASSLSSEDERTKRNKSSSSTMIRNTATQDLYSHGSPLLKPKESGGRRMTNNSLSSQLDSPLHQCATLNVVTTPTIGSSQSDVDSENLESALEKNLLENLYQTAEASPVRARKQVARKKTAPSKPKKLKQQSSTKPSGGGNKRASGNWIERSGLPYSIRQITDEEKLQRVTCIVCKAETPSHTPHHGCPKCSVCFTEIAEFKAHVAGRHKTEGGGWACPLCPKETTDRGHMKDHLDSHANLRQYQCDLCKRAYNTLRSLRIHMQGTHMKEGPPTLGCNLCVAIFHTEKQLKRHGQTVHSTDRPFKCSQCSVTFKCATHLRRHIKGVHERPDRFKCRRCQIRFKDWETYRKHWNLNHDGEKRFQCDKCDKSFKRRDVLLMHQVIHSGQKPFSCNICSHSFCQKNSLGVHMKKHAEQYKYHCRICHSRFKSKKSLTQHKKKEHAGEEFARCMVCMKEFDSQRSMFAHMRVHSQDKEKYKCYHCKTVFETFIGLQVHFSSHEDMKLKPKTRVKVGIRPDSSNIICGMNKSVKSKYTDIKGKDNGDETADCRVVIQEDVANAGILGNLVDNAELTNANEGSSVNEIEKGMIDVPNAGTTVIGKGNVQSSKVCAESGTKKSRNSKQKGKLETAIKKLSSRAKPSKKNNSGGMAETVKNMVKDTTLPKAPRRTSNESDEDEVGFNDDDELSDVEAGNVSEDSQPTKESLVENKPTNLDIPEKIDSRKVNDGSNNDSEKVEDVEDEGMDIDFELALQEATNEERILGSKPADSVNTEPCDLNDNPASDNSISETISETISEKANDSEQQIVADPISSEVISNKSPEEDLQEPPQTEQNTIDGSGDPSKANETIVAEGLETDDANNTTISSPIFQPQITNVRSVSTDPDATPAARANQVLKKTPSSESDDTTISEKRYNTRTNRRKQVRFADEYPMDYKIPRVAKSDATHITKISSKASKTSKEKNSGAVESTSVGSDAFPSTRLTTEAQYTYSDDHQDIPVTSSNQYSETNTVVSYNTTPRTVEGLNYQQTLASTSYSGLPFTGQVIEIVPESEMVNPQKRQNCHLCGKVFSSYNRLLSHELRHIGYKCGTCKKMYATVQALAEHRKTHQHRGLRPYQCDHCGWGCHQKSLLVRHIARHHVV